jgi:hypothetical protein
MERLGLRPGVAVVVEAGVRNASLLVRVGEQNGPVRLSQQLAAWIFVAAESSLHPAV